MNSIRTKLIFWTSVLFVFIGILIYVPLSIILPRKITSQILKRDVKIAEYIADEAKEYLLLNDNTALVVLLNENLTKLEDAQYLFISGPGGNIISHTFKHGFPKALIPVNDGIRHSYAVRELLSNGKRIYCISVPILKGELGNLHLGVSLESNKPEIAAFARINYYVALVIFIGLGIGILIFSLIGLFLSSRIIKLKDFAAKVGEGDLSGRIDLKTKDELGSLANSFNEMVKNLKEKIEIIKRLSHLEERDRIAIEFHDGIAQDLASIIKRLELCERLFKVEAASAFKELNSLRDNTKEVLNKTRQLILNLKSPEEEEFDLLTNLNNYMKNYELQTGIKVDSRILGPAEEVPADKARSIFYIIVEALTNAKKHSMAKNVFLSIEFENNKLAISVKDDGKGFDINEEELLSLGYGKWGLIGMRQRATSLKGAVKIDSGPNEGTCILVKIPLG